MLNKTIWILGDSFSTPYLNDNLDELGKMYIDWKGYTPKTFGDILAEDLGLDIKHLAVCGSDNDTIFEKFYQHYPLMQIGDIVIIGWSSIGRFRLGLNDNRFITLIPNFIDTNVKLLDYISKSTIEEVIVNRDLPIYRKELYDRMEFLNFICKDMKLIQWTPFKGDIIEIHGFKNVNTILMETKGKVWDGHYSESGHQFIASKFKELLLDDMKRCSMNSLYKKLI
jgi:hypothetical protein